MDSKSFIVICTGNTCRSPMAEGLLKSWLSGHGITDITVRSMGLSAYDGDAASQYAIDAMAEMDIDINEHRTRCALKSDLMEAERIYVMTLQHKNVIVEACAELEPNIVVMDVPDPFGQNFTRYCECRDHIAKFFEENPPVETDE